MATMLQALVHAANNNLMESIPSVWALFLEKQVKEARAAAELAYKAQMGVAATINPPLTDDGLTERHVAAEQTALLLFSNLLFSTPLLHSNATTQLALTLEVEHGRADGVNKKRIVEYCNDRGDATREV
jgi:hypothetical protein